MGRQITAGTEARGWEWTWARGREEMGVSEASEEISREQTTILKRSISPELRPASSTRDAEGRWTPCFSC